MKLREIANRAWAWLWLWLNNEKGQAEIRDVVDRALKIDPDLFPTEIAPEELDGARESGSPRPIELVETLKAWGVSKDQEGVTWLTCEGLPILDLDMTFARTADGYALQPEPASPLGTLRPASKAHLALEAAVLQCLEADVWPVTVVRFVHEALAGVGQPAPAQPSPEPGSELKKIEAEPGKWGRVQPEFSSGEEGEWPELTIMREKDLPSPPLLSHHWVWWQIGDYDEDRYEVQRYVPAAPTQPLQGSEVEREENWFSTAAIAADKPEGPWISLTDHTALQAKLQRVEEEFNRKAEEYRLKRDETNDREARDHASGKLHKDENYLASFSYYDGQAEAYEHAGDVLRSQSSTEVEEKRCGGNGIVTETWQRSPEMGGGNVGPCPGCPDCKQGEGEPQTDLELRERLGDIADHIEAGLSLSDEDATFLRELGQPGRIAEVIDAAKRLEDRAHPTARAKVDNTTSEASIYRAQGEVQAAQYLRELLEEEQATSPSTPAHKEGS